MKTPEQMADYYADLARPHIEAMAPMQPGAVISVVRHAYLDGLRAGMEIERGEIIEGESGEKSC